MDTSDDRLCSEVKGLPRLYADPALWGVRFLLAIAVTWVAGFFIGFNAALAILMILGFLVAAVFVARPAVGVLGIGILCTADTLTRALLMQGGWLRYNTLSYFLVTVSIIHLPLILNLRGFQVRIAQLFVIVAAAGLVFSPSPLSATAQLLHLVSPFGLLAYCIAANRDKNREVWYWLGIVNGSLAALGGLVYYVQLSDRLNVDPNEFAYLPLTGLFSICLAQVFPKPKRNGFLVCLAVVNLCWVFLSGSRGSLLVAACCSIYLFVQTSGICRRFLIATAAAVVFLFTVSWFPELTQRTQQRFTRLVNPTLSYRERTSGRSALVEDAWQLFLENPLGVGTGGFISTHMSTFRPKRAIAAHAGWMKLLVENGLPGFCLFGLFVLSFAAIAWHRGPQMFPFGLFVTGTLTVAYVSREFASTGLWFLSVAGMTLLAETAPSSQGNSAAGGQGITGV